MPQQFLGIVLDGINDRLGWGIVKENIRQSDLLLLYLSFPVSMAKHVRSFIFTYGVKTIKTTKNWWSVFLVMLNIKHSSMVHLKNGVSFNLTKERFGKLRALTDLTELQQEMPKGGAIRLDDGTVEMRVSGKKFVFDTDYAGSFGNELFHNVHGNINVKGMEVVDIGGYVGDTSIFYAVNGAKRVYFFEPFPVFFNAAAKAVKMNNLQEKIRLFNMAVGGRRGHIALSASTTNPEAVLPGGKSQKSGTGVPIITLDDLVKRLKLKNAALKVDCEGCEYEIFRNASSDAIRSFDKIHVEYHYGYKTIVDRLKREGYDVTYTKPTLQFHLSDKGTMALGDIVASKKVRHL